MIFISDRNRRERRTSVSRENREVRFMKKRFLVLTLGAAMMMGMAVHADGEKTVLNFYEHSDS